MTLLVDTSVWSLALRRDGSATAPEVRALQGALAGKNVAALQVQAVRTLDLRLTDTGLLANAIRVRLSGASDWAQTIDVSGAANSAAWQAELKSALESLQGIGRNNLLLQEVPGAAGTFRLVASGALAGKALPSIELRSETRASLPARSLA